MAARADQLGPAVLRSVSPFGFSPDDNAAAYRCLACGAKISERIAFSRQSAGTRIDLRCQRCATVNRIGATRDGIVQTAEPGQKAIPHIRRQCANDAGIDKDSH